jgi:hypothetical protein
MNRNEKMGTLGSDFPMNKYTRPRVDRLMGFPSNPSQPG